MKRMTLTLVAAAALAGPVALLAQQDAALETPARSSDEPFPWFTFIEPDPLPGGYIFSVSVEDFVLLDAQDREAAELFEALLTGDDREMERHYFCVADVVERFDLFDEIANDEGTCEFSPVTSVNDAFEIGAVCRDEAQGSRMRMSMAGQADESGINASLQMNTKDRNMGHLQMDMRIVLERIGECSDLPQGVDVQMVNPASD